MRRNKQTTWIWVIIFIPYIGSIAYIFSEMFSGQDMQRAQSGIGDAINPGGRIKKLETNLRFSDTFQNRIALADAYLQKGLADNAINLYESSLTGNFSENEYVLSQLIIAYFQKKQYEKVIPLGKKIHKQPQFARSKPHILYAMSLDYTGQPEQAEAEFKMMKGKFSNFEARYQYAKFLSRNNHKDEAVTLLSEIVEEAPHLSGLERRANSQWISMAKDEVKKMRAVQS